MTSTDRDTRPQSFDIEPRVAKALIETSVVHDLDRSQFPLLLVKVPDLEKALQADVGLEIDREEDGCITLSVLLYDIPTEPVSYDLRLYPSQADHLRFLRSFIEKAQFRLHPCQHTEGGWRIAPVQTFRLPPNVLLRLKSYSLAWPRGEGPEPAGFATEPEIAEGEPDSPPAARSPDPRDTVIRKLKEQVHALRAQVQERDKRIIELEDELHDLKSKGRSYRLSGEKKPWWKPFS